MQSESGRRTEVPTSLFVSMHSDDTVSGGYVKVPSSDTRAGKKGVKISLTISPSERKKNRKGLVTCTYTFGGPGMQLSSSLFTFQSLEK